MTFSLEDYIYVRGLPVHKAEIVRFQQQFGGQLFDESVFPAGPKRLACANVIRALDHRLGQLRFLKQDPDYMPETVDIGDKMWFYFPVGFDFGDFATFGKTEDRPTKLVGWFRRKRQFAGISFPKQKL